MSKKKLDRYPNYKLVFDYVYNIVEGRINVNKAQVKGCKRFLRMLEDDRYDFDPRPCETLRGCQCVAVLFCCKIFINI